MFGWALNGRKPEPQDVPAAVAGPEPDEGCPVCGGLDLVGLHTLFGARPGHVKLHETGSLCACESCKSVLKWDGRKLRVRERVAPEAQGEREGGASPVFAGPDPRPMMPNIPRISRGIAYE